jgi:hypothetical protein
MNRKIFIECGVNDGDNLNILHRHNFLSKFNDVYCFEALPFYNDLEIYKTVNFINKAVWVKDEKIKIYVAGKGNVSSSVFLSKYTSNENNYLVVDAINFSEWIKNNFDESDEIFLDMDIECTEYPLIEKLIEDSTIKYIKYLSVEWHTYKCGFNIPELENKLKSFDHLTLIDHDSFLKNPNKFYE